jgi:hypothetical protein
MAFVKIDKSATGGWRSDLSEPNVRMSCHLQDDKTPRSVAFYINHVLIDKVGWTTTMDSNGRTSLSVAIHEGTGEDAGFLMLEESDAKNGYVLAVSKPGAFTYGMNASFTRFKHYVINEVPTPLMDVEFTYDAKDKTVLIQCPDWLRYNPLSVPEEKKPAVIPTSPLPVEQAKQVDADRKKLPQYIPRSQRSAKDRRLGK